MQAAPSVEHEKRAEPTRLRMGVLRFLSRRRLLGLLLLALLGGAAFLLRFHLVAWYHYRAARGELQKYHNPQAIRHLRLCRDTWPNDPDVLLLAAHPTDPALHCTLGQILWRGGQREEGIRWLQSALQLDPRYAPARQALEEYLRQKKSGRMPGR